MDIKEFSNNQNQFIEYLKNNRRVSINTIAAYQRDLNQLLDFLTKSKNNINSIDQALSQFISYLYNKKLTVQSVARKISCINTFKSFLISKGYILTSKFKRPAIANKNPQILTYEQIQTIMDQTTIEDLPTKFPFRDMAIIELLYATGIQCSELVQIEIQNIDFNNQTISIRNKYKKERIVLFGTKALKSLNNYIKFERIEIQNFEEKLFLNYRNQPLTVRSIQRICKMFRQCLKVKEIITPNTFRNSFACHMLSNGVTTETVQNLLGHKTRISTERYIKCKTKI